MTEDIWSDIWSNTRVNGRQLTWREAYERIELERQRLRRFADLLLDLDRCQHGRHEGDDCGSCGGPSYGNPFLDQCAEGGFCATEDGRPALPRQIGYTMASLAIIVPKGRAQSDPMAWVAEQ